MNRLRTLALFAVAALPLGARAAPPPHANVDPQADATLRRMSDYLGRLPTFRVRASAVDEVVTTQGQKLQGVSQADLAVKRPSALRSDRLGPATDVTVRYDGRNLSVYGKRAGLYAMAPAPQTIDDTIDYARDRYGIEAPGADLLFSRPYDVLTADVTEGRYLGVEPIDGVPCHHLAFREPDVDWQIWIEDGPRPLPRRYVITSKRVQGAPEYAVHLTNWEPNVPLSDSLFVFTPPPGSRRIQFLASPSAAR